MAEERYTKTDGKEAVRLRHRKDKVFESACVPRPENVAAPCIARLGVCRKYPTARAAATTTLRFERTQQGDEEYVALTGAQPPAGARPTSQLTASVAAMPAAMRLQRALPDSLRASRRAERGEHDGAGELAKERADHVSRMRTRDTPKR